MCAKPAVIASISGRDPDMFERLGEFHGRISSVGWASPIAAGGTAGALPLKTLWRVRGDLDAAPVDRKSFRIRPRTSVSKPEDPINVVFLKRPEGADGSMACAHWLCVVDYGFSGYSIGLDRLSPVPDGSSRIHAPTLTISVQIPEWELTVLIWDGRDL